MSTNPVPEIYVLWHPDCHIAKSLAIDIYEWLRPGNGMGPQVFYRSPAAPEAPEGGLPLPIPGESRSAKGARNRLDRKANVQILVVLANADMIADPAWRIWLQDLSAPSTSLRRVFIPVALDPTAFNIPNPIRKLNFLRPAGLPLPPEGKSEAARRAQASALETVSRSLLKQLTETLCRFMIAESEASEDATGGSSFEKLTIFLSHAKADGTNPATRIRDYIYSKTQLKAFYDENDIAFGSAFADRLESALDAHETAALIAVRSAHYAGRPWCRRELTAFRWPRPAPSDGNGRAQRWLLHPTLVVEAMGARERTLGIPEFGNSICLRWDDTQDEQEELIVTTVLRDVMLSAFHAAIGAALEADANYMVLNWLPDPTSLLAIDQVRDGEKNLRIVYPGRSMPLLELNILSRFFPHVTFYSFEEFLS